jgi:D-alanyl-D-alanine dipeptidase
MYDVAIKFNSDITISDIIAEKTLDVTSLKQDDMGAPVREHANEGEAIDARSDELAQIADFIAKHGATLPTEADYEPKKISWRGKKSKKTDKQVASERRGRRRTTFAKAVTFVRIHTADVDLGEGNDEFKRAGRGRAKKGEVRESFTLHYTNVEKASTGTWSRAQLQAMSKVSR